MSIEGATLDLGSELERAERAATRLLHQAEAEDDCDKHILALEQRNTIRALLYELSDHIEDPT